MSKPIEVSASILSADFTRLADEIKRSEDAGVDRFHIDVMDGHFVPNLTIGALIVEAIRPLTSLTIEAHLMIENPGRYVDDFVKAGSDVICVHAECFGERKAECRGPDEYPKEIGAFDAPAAKTVLSQIRKGGKQAYLTLNPGTDDLLIDPVLPDLDGVLVMSVNPGFAGQKFMPAVLAKIQRLRGRFDGAVAVDGGIQETTAPEAVKAGADVLITASYFYGSKKPRDTVKYLKDLRT